MTLRTRRREENIMPRSILLLLFAVFSAIAVHAQTDKDFV